MRHGLSNFVGHFDLPLSLSGTEILMKCCYASCTNQLCHQSPNDPNEWSLSIRYLKTYIFCSID